MNRYLHAIAFVLLMLALAGVALLGELLSPVGAP